MNTTHQAAQQQAVVAKTVLHIGCGEASPQKLPSLFQQPGWKEMRLDINEKVRPDIVASMTDMRSVAENSMDAVFLAHTLEHVYPHQVPVAIQEFFRVLKPGGILMMVVPDMQTIAAYIADGKWEEPLYKTATGATISPIDVVYGWRPAIASGNVSTAHHNANTAKSLAQHLLGTGFINISLRREWVELWAAAYKPQPGAPKQSKASLINGKLVGKDGQQLPTWYLRTLQMAENPSVKTDELDTAPFHWKPVGLKTPT